MSWEWNMIFYSNKKIHKLHIKGYFTAKNSFLAEILFKRLHADAPTWIQHPAKFSGHKYFESGDFSNCRVISRWSHDQMVIWL